jgi:hypothetical protein
MNKKNIVIYICIIIVVLTFVLKPRLVHATCSNTIAKVYNALIVVAKTISNPSEASVFIHTMYEVLFNRDITPCDDNGSPIDAPIFDPNNPYPTTDPNASIQGPLPPIGNNSNERAFHYASKISPKIDICNYWGSPYYCKHTNTVNCDAEDSQCGLISSRLRKGEDGGTSQTGLYWCATYTEDVTRFALGRNINITEYVIGQTTAWKNNGFPYFAYYSTTTESQKKEILQTIKPGCLMFQMESVTVHQAGKQHVAVVMEVDINSFGDGWIRTLDANGPGRISSYDSNTWVLSAPWMKTNVSFGCLP